VTAEMQGFASVVRDNLVVAIGRDLQVDIVRIADLSTFKNVPIGRVTAQIRTEAFNAFNWVNLGLPSSILFDVDGTPFAGAGRITSTSTPARQVQIGLKFIF
jgi:hypothetical protein